MERVVPEEELISTVTEYSHEIGYTIAAVVFAGLRYMFASADQKADIKKSMGILAIGAVLVFGATLLIRLIGNTASNIL